MFRRNKINTIGRTEVISFPEDEVYKVTAKIDTGAYTSSVWATDVNEVGGVLSFKLLDSKVKGFSGKVLSTKNYHKVVVYNSFGHSEKRFRVQLVLNLGGKSFKTDFTLADRSLNTYPILIGRKALKNRFVVDVSKSAARERKRK